MNVQNYKHNTRHGPHKVIKEHVMLQKLNWKLQLSLPLLNKTLGNFRDETTDKQAHLPSRYNVQNGKIIHDGILMFHDEWLKIVTINNDWLEVEKTNHVASYQKGEMQRETATDFLGDVALQAQLGYNQKPPKNPL